MNDETMKKIDQVTNEVSEKITNEQLTETRDEATGKPVNEQPKERAKEPIEEPVKELDADAGVDATEEPIEKPIEEPIEEPIQPTSHTKKATRDEPRVGLANSEFQRGNQEVPEEIKKWNWGAFSLNIIWGIGNKTYLPLLCLIPLFNFVWVFICGFKGNEGAWRDGNYTDVETFKQVQKTWSRAGIAMFIIQIVIILLYLVFVVFILSSLWYIRDSFIRDSYNYDPYIYDGYYY
ncbi:hypothetical protein IGK08_000612 [Enterococcus sp. DIV1286c]|uniref:Uncharacterized protein n=1 Tax=Enterococcus mundtii TaxID=53346 RepID=A0AAI8RAW6_ENTMU|nr:hypothetical protein LEUM_1902 [Enterococcus mundtii QU 25]BBM15448.1 uncharacterized protein EM151A_2261 [Enterococcus mundtii]GKS55770.1 hypothetical protein EMLAB_23850 [Enterococcus mundtii]